MQTGHLKQKLILKKDAESEEKRQTSLQKHGNLLQFISPGCAFVVLGGELRHIMSLQVRQTDPGRQALH